MKDQLHQSIHDMYRVIHGVYTGRSVALQLWGLYNEHIDTHQRYYATYEIRVPVFTT